MEDVSASSSIDSMVFPAPATDSGISGSVSEIEDLSLLSQTHACQTCHIEFCMQELLALHQSVAHNNQHLLPANVHTTTLTSKFVAFVMDNISQLQVEKAEKDPSDPNVLVVRIRKADGSDKVTTHPKPAPPTTTTQSKVAASSAECQPKTVVSRAAYSEPTVRYTPNAVSCQYSQQQAYDNQNQMYPMSSDESSSYHHGSEYANWYYNWQSYAGYAMFNQNPYNPTGRHCHHGPFNHCKNFKLFFLVIRRKSDLVNSDLNRGKCTHGASCTYQHPICPYDANQNCSTNCQYDHNWRPRLCHQCKIMTAYANTAK